MSFPIWSCSMRGLACHVCYQPRGALLPHLFTLTLRLAFGALRRRALAQGGMFSVPLSVGSPRPGVTRRIALWSSDFPLLSAFALGLTASELRRDSSDHPAHCGKPLMFSVIRPFPARSCTARASCTDYSEAYRSPRRSSRCSSYSLSASPPDRRVRSRT